jgi:hypothetical protein
VAQLVTAAARLQARPGRRVDSMQCVSRRNFKLRFSKLLKGAWMLTFNVAGRSCCMTARNQCFYVFFRLPVASCNRNFHRKTIRKEFSFVSYVDVVSRFTSISRPGFIFVSFFRIIVHRKQIHQFLFDICWDTLFVSQLWWGLYEFVYLPRLHWKRIALKLIWKYTG